MARMHTGKHGKAKSRKPVAEQVVIPEGAPSKEEAAKLIADYAKQGMHHAAIGQKLRDEHSIPYIKHYFGKRLHVVLEEEKVAGEYPQDFMDLLKRAVKIRRHLAKNKNDKHNTTSFENDTAISFTTTGLPSLSANLSIVYMTLECLLTRECV